MDCVITEEITNSVDINKKLVSYKQCDKKNNREFDIDVDIIMMLNQRQNNHCANCNAIMLWQYSSNNPRQFTVDRINSSLGHTRENVMLTCLECNRRRGKFKSVLGGNCISSGIICNCSRTNPHRGAVESNL